jgi:transitional endoplasmic reticulum ATPase
MDNYTGAEIAAVCNEAVMLAIRDIVTSGKELSDAEMEKRKVGMKYFERAMANVVPRGESAYDAHKKFASGSDPNAAYR